MFDILTPEEYGEYETFLRGHPNATVYQSPAWRGMRNNAFDAAVVRGTDGAIQGGMSVFKIKDHYGYYLYAIHGPVAADGDGAVLSELLRGMKALAKKHGAYTLYMDPVLRRDDAVLQEAFQEADARIEFVEYKENAASHVVYVLDIEGLDEEAVFANFPGTTRHKIRKAGKKGVTVSVGSGADVEAFYELYLQTTKRQGFPPRPKSYFVKLLELFDTDTVRLYKAELEGELLSAAIAIQFGRRTNYVFGASGESHRDAMPNYLLQWEMIRWAIGGGSVLYSFEGIPGYKNPAHPAYGVYRFKQGFNGRVLEYVGDVNLVYKALPYGLSRAAAKVKQRL